MLSAKGETIEVLSEESCELCSHASGQTMLPSHLRLSGVCHQSLPGGNLSCQCQASLTSRSSSPMPWVDSLVMLYIILILHLEDYLFF
jgi:hypothetical protein